MKWAFLMGLLIASASGCSRGVAMPFGPDAEVRHEGGTGLDGACKHAETPADRASACLTLAGYLEDGAFGLPHDPGRALLLRATAIDTLEASCDLGEVMDCTRAAKAIGASLVSMGESDPALAESAMWMERYAKDGCRGGDVAGCALLGSMYEQGRLVAHDPARSKDYYDKACSGGHRRSCLRLADLAQGKEASRAYERACDAGSGFGCAAAGLHHQKSAGPKSTVDQVVYFARGCSMGDPASCLLGVEVYQREDTANRRSSESRKGAASFAWTGCQHGIPDACLILGDAFARGDGVPKNPRAAFEAYDKACEAGLREGCDAIRPAKRRPLPRSETARTGWD